MKAITVGCVRINDKLYISENGRKYEVLKKKLVLEA